MNPLDKNDQVLALREGGRVTRCHTREYHGFYNIAIHSFNALNLLLVLNPESSMNLIKAIMWHDVAERWTGDVPAPAKWSSPFLKNLLDMLEDRILRRIGINQPFDDLTESEKNWLSAIDLLELDLWAIEQIDQGNRNVQDIREKVWNVFHDKQKIFPKEVVEFYRNFKFKKLPDCDEFLDA